MTFFLHKVLVGLALGTCAVACRADTCDLKLDGLTVEVERLDAQLDLAVLDHVGLLRTRLTLPADGPLRGCWVLDADADGRDEVVLATAVADLGQPAALRAFHWTGERLEPVSLPALLLDREFADTPREQLVETGRVLFRTLKLGQRELHFRYNREQGGWTEVEGIPPRRGDAPADQLLQAPISR